MNTLPEHYEVSPDACERSPEAIHQALAARPEWLRSFEKDFLSAAADFDSRAMDAALDRWHPYALYCATPEAMAQDQELVRRINAGETEGMVFYDDQGNAYNADNNPIEVE